MMVSSSTIRTIKLILLLAISQQIQSYEDGYLRYVKDGCFLRSEALSCVKYRALKIAKTTFFDRIGNETIQANQMISFVPLDEETLKDMKMNENSELLDEPKGFMSEWAALTKYVVKLVTEFFKMKGLKVNLPDGARTIEEEGVIDDARGRRKRLAVLIPLLTLLAAFKTKLLLIPVLLAVLLIKKLLLIAALLLPGLLSTLKACKHHHPMTHYSYFGSSDSSDYNSDYGNSYSYSSGGGVGKDWASNRAYTKHRPSQPLYITSPGASA